MRCKYKTLFYLFLSYKKGYNKWKGKSLSKDRSLNQIEIRSEDRRENSYALI